MKPSDSANPKSPVVLRAILALPLAIFFVHFLLHAGDEMRNLETWIDGLGALGPVAFVLAVVVLTSAFFPSSLLAAAGGALFGLGWGTCYMGAGMFVAAGLNYVLAKSLLKGRITRFFARRPRWNAIERAVKREDWRFQFMLRLTPINAVLLNYLLGAAGVRYSNYLFATIGLLPGVFVQVYFGHLTTHLAKIRAGNPGGSTIHTVLVVAGFLFVAALLMKVTQMTRRAIAEAEVDPSALSPS